MFYRPSSYDYILAKYQTMLEKILPKNLPPPKKRIHIQTSKAIFHFRAFLLCRTNELSHNGSEALTSFYAITSDDIHNPQPIPWRNKIIIFKFSGFQFGSVQFHRSILALTMSMDETRLAMTVSIQAQTWKNHNSTNGAPFSGIL